MQNGIRWSLWTCLIALVCAACSSKPKIVNKFNDENIQKIYEICDKRQIQELAVWLEHPDPNLRAEAAMCMASIRDTATTPYLMKVIRTESDPLVQTNLLYAIGQSGDGNQANLLAGMLYKYASDARGEAIVATAKLMVDAMKKGLNIDYAVREMRTLQLTDESMRQSFGRALIILHSGGYSSPELVERLPYVLQYAEHDSKVSCAMGMARYKGEWSEKMKEYLRTWLKVERDAEAKIVMVSMIPKLGDPNAVGMLMDYAKSQSFDVRIRVAAIRALNKIDNKTLQQIAPLLSDSDPVVVEEALAMMATLKDLNGWSDLSSSITVQSPMCAHWKAKWQYKTDGLAESLVSAFQNATERPTKIQLAKAWGVAPALAMATKDRIIAESDPALKNAFAEALAEQGQSEKWDKSISFATLAVEAINNGDMGVVATLAGAVRPMAWNDADKASLAQACRNAMSKCVLPREVETYNECVNTINQLIGENTPVKKTDYNHPLDWKLIKSISADQKVRVVTSRGEMIWQLNVEQAPGTVASFATLVKQGFFDGKMFHRVIPGFVAQGGCPRGDGWGSTDYSLRSEFASHHYTPGAVGMASSGDDTEGCQWFITLQETPHLEGRYTIFANVTTGLDLIQKILYGDEIIKIEWIES